MLTKRGGVAAQLQHAIDQAKDWLNAFEDHRLACLECLDLRPEQVNRVSAVVIAGRDTGYPVSATQGLRRHRIERVRVLFFDDLLRSLLALSNQTTLEN